MPKLSDRLKRLEDLTASDVERLTRIEICNGETGEVCFTIELQNGLNGREVIDVLRKKHNLLGEQGFRPIVRLPQKNND